jgi:hypothetical protein
LLGLESLRQSQKSLQFQGAVLLHGRQKGKRTSPLGRAGPADDYAWIDNYQGASFSDAKRQFLSAEHAVNEKLERLERFAELHSNPSYLSENAFIVNEVDALNQRVRERQRIQRRIEEMVAEERDLNERFYP